MRLFGLVTVLILLTTARAEARRSAIAPRIAAGVQSASNDDTDAWLSLGVGWYQPDRIAATTLLATVDLDIGDGVVTAVPTARAGVTLFEKRDGGWPLISVYGIGGFGMREFDGEADLIGRMGVGLSIPPLLLAVQLGLAIPDIAEVTVDVGARETVAMVRVGWGI